MELKGINHITFSVSNLENSIDFYRNVFDADILVKKEKLAYFDLNGLWLALNEERCIPRNEIYESYTHISFSIDDKEYEVILENLQRFGVDLEEGRSRDKREGLSIYFRDPDGHLFEFHTKGRSDRIKFYKEECENMKYFE